MSTRWQFSITSLFVLMTFVAVASTLFAKGGNWWILAVLVVGDAIWFCILTATCKIDEQPQQTQRLHQEKEQTE